MTPQLTPASIKYKYSTRVVQTFFFLLLDVLVVVLIIANRLGPGPDDTNCGYPSAGRCFSAAFVHGFTSSKTAVDLRVAQASIVALDDNTQKHEYFSTL